MGSFRERRAHPWRVLGRQRQHRRGGRLGDPGAGNLAVAGQLRANFINNDGQSWLRGQVYCGSVFGRWDDAATLCLWGSRIYDTGDGFLQFKSGGGKVYFWDTVTVRGMLNKAGGGFKIDHPLDPAGKYLSHSFVESPEMMNVYSGTVVTDGDGTATVVLPEYFETLNRDHRFQVTPIGQLAMATVDGEVRDNAFTIRTDRPKVTVSWQVTGVRQDKWAEQNRVRVEEEKPEGERALFLHPEVFGEPESLGLPFLPQCPCHILLRADSFSVDPATRCRHWGSQSAPCQRQPTRPLPRPRLRSAASRRRSGRHAGGRRRRSWTRPAT